MKIKCENCDKVVGYWDKHKVPSKYYLIKSVVMTGISEKYKGEVASFCTMKCLKEYDKKNKKVK